MSAAAGAKPTEPALELLRFRAVPAGTDAVVLEVEGRFAGPGQRRLGRPRLLVRAEDRRLEALAVVGQEAFAGSDAAVWRAVYALPLAAVDGAFTLAVGRRLLLDLPQPHVETAEGALAAHHVRLAREANALRHRADEAHAALAAATAHRDRLAGELATSREEAGRLRDELAIAREAAQELESQRATANREIERVRREADSRAHRMHQEHSSRLEAARRAAEEAMAAAREESLHRLEEAVAAQRAQTLAARHALKGARAEIEALHREHPGTRARRGQRDGPGREEVPDEEAGDEAPGDEQSRERQDAATATAEHALDLDAADLEPTTDEVARAQRETTQPVPLEPAAEDDTAATETVRVLNPRARRPRRDLAAEARVANEHLPVPGAGEIGAQHISAATGRRGLAARAADDPSRALALAALAVFVLAVLAIVLGLGPL